MEDRVAIIATDGNGSLAACARALAASVANPTVVVRGCSGGFGHRLVGRYAARCFAEDMTIVRRLRALETPLLHLTSHHLARYGPLTGKRYVVTVHDLMRHRDRFADGDPLIHEPNARDRLHLIGDAAGLRRADALVAVSEHTRREVIELLGVDPARVSVVPEGVDTDAFRPVDRRLLSDPYILYVGSEQPRKNLGTLFAAFLRLRARWPGLKLVKVGAPGGPEASFRARTLAQACATGALPHILFAQRVSHADLVAWYSGALCLVQPSRQEGFGLPPLEAMACGCPVVASSGGALPEVVGDAGLVYGRPDDVAALAAALDKLLSGKADRLALARAGRERAAFMTWERTARLTRAVWRAVLSEPLDRSIAWRWRARSALAQAPFREPASAPAPARAPSGRAA